MRRRCRCVGPTSYGKEHDQLTSLSYYGFRFYDRLTLTWTQADPLYRIVPDLAWDEPRRANLYSFSLNNPLRYYDPDGRNPEDEENARRNRQFIETRGGQEDADTKGRKRTGGTAEEDGGESGDEGVADGEGGGEKKNPKLLEGPGWGPKWLQSVWSAVIPRVPPEVKTAVEILMVIGAAKAIASGVSELASAGSSRLRSIVASRRGVAAVRAGQAGEQAVRAAYNIGAKVRIRVGGRVRIPDGLTSTTLSEVKNVSSLSYTKQLRDFADYAQQNSLRFDLYVRPTTQLSGPLSDAVSNGVINLRLIP